MAITLMALHILSMRLCITVVQLQSKRDGSDIQGRSTRHHTAIGFMQLSVETANNQWILSSQPSRTVMIYKTQLHALNTEVY